MTEEKQESRKAPNKKFPFRTFLTLGIFFILLMGVIVLVKRACRPAPPPPAPPGASTSADLVDFYKAMRNTTRQTAEGKKLFRNGQTSLNGSKPVESLPESSLAESMNDPTAKAAENFALAQEHFELAKKTLREVKLRDSVPAVDECRSTILNALDQYTKAADILNEHSKGRLNGEAKKIKSNAPTDADANFQMGDKLMEGVLLGGCQGEFFKWAKTLDPADRGLIYVEDKEFFGEKFPEHQVHLQAILEYQEQPANALPQDSHAP